MNRLSAVLLGVFISVAGMAQRAQVDSLLKALNTVQADSSRINIFRKLGNYYSYNNNTIALSYYEKALALSKKINNPLKTASNNYSLGYVYLQKGDFAKSLDNYLQAVNLYQQLKDSVRLANTFLSISDVYDYHNDFNEIRYYRNKALQIAESLKDSTLLTDVYGARGQFYDRQNLYDSALLSYKKGYQIALAMKDNNEILTFLSNMGLTYKHQHYTAKALQYFDSALVLCKTVMADNEATAIVYNNIAATQVQAGDYATATSNFNKSISLAVQTGAESVILENYRNLADMYATTKDYQQEVNYLKKYHALKDSLYTSDTKNQLTQLEADYQIGQKNTEITQKQAEVEKQTNERNLFLAIAAAAALLLLVSIIFYTRIKTKNSLLIGKNNEINQQKETLQNTLTHLKNTQTQLIHSEKMASLGELTAGVAHEIQNPLNFVNNFSELNVELTEELKQELLNHNTGESLLLADDIKENAQKILYHGKRADSIVKGMLQHSRTGTGQYEMTDINKLADEYLRLSYHGLRAKNKSFNATMQTHFDESIGRINIIPQDISRVLLNLFNNAFYAVNEKKIKLNGTFEPAISVSTKKLDGKVEIVVKDNGNGIPPNIIDKIFQPFFTTKPTGQGTGLGLSLSYDIIKAHGGDIKVESKEGGGTEFTMVLPCT